MSEEKRRKLIKTGIINEFYVNKVMNDANVLKAKDYFISNEGEYCISFEKMDRTLEDRIQQEIDRGKPF